MSLVRDRADWIRLCDVGQLSAPQRFLVEAVLAASDPQVVLTRHVACARTIVTSIAHAHSALESRGRPHRVMQQPYVDLTLSLVMEALAACESSKSSFEKRRLDGVVNTLSSIAERGTTGITSPQDCAAAALELAMRASEVRSVVADCTLAAWEFTASAASLQQLALELAALCLIEGRCHRLLVEDLRTALSGGPIGARQLLEVLLPDRRDFRVAVIVEGTSRLKSLADLMDPEMAPTTIAPGEPVTGWGRRTRELKALADLAADASRARHAWSPDQAGAAYVLLTFTVRACDLGGAAFLGRRRASELLDQYVAGQRIAEVRMRPETLAHDPESGRYQRLMMPVLSSGSLQPLTIYWPPALRECLRTAHIARITEAPMTAAGLCWAALESLEVKAKSRNSLARALSLQAVRQQALDLYQQMTTSVLGRLRALTKTVRTAESKAKSLETASAGTGDKRLADLTQRATEARVNAYNYHAQLEHAYKLEAHRAVVAAWLMVADDGKLNDVDRWLDVLALPAEAEPELRAAAAAISTIADHLGGEVGMRLQTWRTFLAAPASLADWIDDTARQFENSLSWLYALRNTALHDGRFISATDALDAHAGRGIVDLTLEFLGNWYGQAASASTESGGLKAIEVIRCLAERQQTVLVQLRSGTRTGMNVTHLTSPTSNGWDRERQAISAGEDGECPSQ